MLLSVLFVFIGSSQAASVHNFVDEPNCPVSSFICASGECLTFDRICDGKRDCPGGDDETMCDGYSDDSLKAGRYRRQATTCRRNQWQCKDGTCIGFDGRCDGNVDCPDRSDETHALCRNLECQSNWFRCTYGACVDGTAPCNGVTECADNSDELLPRCRNETDEVRGEFRCANGQMIPSAERCDGEVNCRDGSDETVRACAATTCSAYLFQCAYGACVDQGSDCDGKQDCADGSDEAEDLCNRSGTDTTKPVGPVGPVEPVTQRPVNPPPQGNMCVLPPYPEWGGYTVGGNPNARPGQAYPAVFLNVSCNPGYGVEGDRVSLQCYNGVWSGSIPQCVRLCRLYPHASVEYHCLFTGSAQGSRVCGSLEPVGTVVKPVCRSPNYYYPDVLKYMRCIDGNWDYIAICKPECGTITPEGIQLVIGGRSARRGELPWHAGIYSKTTTPYMQICGGSLVSRTTIISAAHCFWSDIYKLLPASDYAAAVGKIYRPWNNKHDADAQKSDVKDIQVSPYFRGAAANYQDDIALVIVSTPFTYEVFIRPVCVDFDPLFSSQQLKDGNLGKVAGWGLVASNGNASQVLKVVELPFVRIDECFGISPPNFREYITSDKICAGYTNGTTLCQGDSGGGLAFPASERGALRYYLRGVVSTAPRNQDLCNAHTLTTFTQITKHEQLIKEFI